MRYLLDTDILYEIRRRDCSPALISWLSAAYFSQCYISVITLGEIRRDLEKRRRYDPNYASLLEGWLDDLENKYKDNILPFDQLSAEQWGILMMDNPGNSMDMQIAAIAIINRCVIVTRHGRHYQHLPVHVINPLEKAR